MTNTAESLRFYLGRVVYLSQGVSQINGGRLEKGKYKLTRLHFEKEGVFLNDGLPVHCSFIYPILKTAEELTEEDAEFVYERYCFEPYKTWAEDDFGISPDFVDGVLPFDSALKLFDRGYGAVPCKESPTGYRSVFHSEMVPCVTPKQVEKGIEL